MTQALAAAQTRLLELLVDVRTHLEKPESAESPEAGEPEQDPSLLEHQRDVFVFNARLMLATILSIRLPLDENKPGHHISNEICLVIEAYFKSDHSPCREQ